MSDMTQKIPESSAPGARAPGDSAVDKAAYPAVWERILDTEYEFSVWRGDVGAMTDSHTHTDIEVNRVEQGSVTYFAAGRFQTIQAGEIVVFWAGMPHQLVESSPGTTMAWIVIPLAWFMQWHLPQRFAHQLLEGEFHHCDNASLRDQDTLQFARWADEMVSPTPETLHIVSLEVEARLWRVALAESAANSSEKAPARASLAGATASGPAIRQVETMARFLSLNYGDDLTIAQIAAAVGLHPHYAMEVWKRSCGLSLWEYLTRLRVSHAQRLLLTSDWKVGRIADESGFGSLSRFYAAFERYCGVTPSAWRKGHTQSGRSE
jgi:AraC-like DNA-binding protein/quercetin dioxygenase-like cupin family protein